MGAPIVYRWDDGNAPVCRGERRSLCDILYACLVTGYGTKPGAGWTREYVNATFDKAAFRNNPATGTGFFLQVDGLGGANGYTPKIQAFESMSSESDGLFPFYASVSTMQVSNAANTTARPWILIADDRFFYFINWYSSTAAPSTTDNLTSGVLFGDIVPWKSDDAYACCLHAYSYGLMPNTVIASTALGNITSDPAFPRKYSGALGSSYLAAVCINGGPCVVGSPGAQGMAYVAGDPILYFRPFLNDGVGFTIRGWLPGLYYPCQVHPFSQFQQITADDKNFIAFKTYCVSTSVGSYLISLDDWRA